MPTFHHHHAVRPALFYLVAESSASEGGLLPLKLQFPVKKSTAAPTGLTKKQVLPPQPRQIQFVTRERKGVQMNVDLNMSEGQCVWASGVLGHVDLADTDFCYT